MITGDEEKATRMALWLGHGHEGLYGDDGEMQCSRCQADYKRDPLDLLAKLVVKVVATAERERIAGLLRDEANRIWEERLGVDRADSLHDIAGRLESGGEWSKP